MKVTAFTFALVAAVSSGCSINIAHSGDGSGGGAPNEAEDQLNALLRMQYPNGHEAGSVSVDDSIHIATPPGDETMAVSGGSNFQVSVGYTSSDPVTSVCIGFGSANNAWCVPTTSSGVQTSGTPTAGAASVAVMLPPDICNNLSSICHSIRCYEFASTSAGTFSRSNAPNAR